MATTEVAKLVSQAWKSLPAEEREEWEEMARKDKARYEIEKTMYNGPWKIPVQKRSQKDPNAPKRPMSAFLSFSNSKRAKVKEENPHVGNAEISRILAKMWKEAPGEERKKHIDREYKLRQEYKTAIASWKKKCDEQIEATRKARENEALRTVLATASKATDDPTTAGYEGEQTEIQHDGKYETSNQLNHPPPNAQQQDSSFQNASLPYGGFEYRSAPYPYHYAYGTQEDYSQGTTSAQLSSSGATFNRNTPRQVEPFTSQYQPSYYQQSHQYAYGKSKG